MKSFRQFLKDLFEANSFMGYDSWGMISPKGKIIEGDDADEETRNYGYSHEGLILKLGMSGYGEAYREGYVRWIVSKGGGNKFASFSFEGNKNRAKLLKMLENIKEFLLLHKQEITGEVYLECDDRQYNVFADNINSALRSVNLSIDQLQHHKEPAQQEVQPDAHQMAFLKKFGKHSKH